MDGDGDGDGTKPFENNLSDLVEIDANQCLNINPRTFSRREIKRARNTLSPWTHAKRRELFDAVMNNYHDISNPGIIASTVRPLTLSGSFFFNFQRSLEPNMSMEYLKLQERVKRIINIKSRRSTEHARRSSQFSSVDWLGLLSIDNQRRLNALFEQELLWAKKLKLSDNHIRRAGSNERLRAHKWWALDADCFCLFWIVQSAHCFLPWRRRSGYSDTHMELWHVVWIWLCAFYMHIEWVAISCQVSFS